MLEQKKVPKFVRESCNRVAEVTLRLVHDKREPVRHVGRQNRSGLAAVPHRTFEKRGRRGRGDTQRGVASTGPGEEVSNVDHDQSQRLRFRLPASQALLSDLHRLRILEEVVAENLHVA